MKYKPGIFSEIIVFVITSHRVHICQLSDLRQTEFYWYFTQWRKYTCNVTFFVVNLDFSQFV